MSAPALPDVAAWDLPLLRGAVATLTAVADRLVPWRARMEDVGRTLGDTRCWYGPAGTAAGAALVEVSTVATAVMAALGESLEHAHVVLGAADTAQDLAAQALAAAAAVPVVLDGAGRLAGPVPADPAAAPGAGGTAAALRAEELATEALQAAARASAAASASGEALAGLGVGSLLAPVAFDDLAGLVAAVPTPAPAPPWTGRPEEVAAWWGGLPTAARLAAVTSDPARIGALDGVPAWARDRANRLVLARVLADPWTWGHEVAQATAAEIARRESAGDHVQLYQFEPGEDLVALALGDVDTADSVAVLVPGIFNSPRGDLAELADDAAAVGGAALVAAPTRTVAAIAWLGYRTPHDPVTVLNPWGGGSAGKALDRSLRGIAAVRTTDPARVSVVAHSYGTVVASRASDQPGELPAEALVLNGSPGLREAGAAGLEIPEVYDASAPDDPVRWIGHYGRDPEHDDFGSTGLPVEWGTGHSGYYDPDHPTLAAIGEVVAGTRDPGEPRPP